MARINKFLSFVVVSLWRVPFVAKFSGVLQQIEGRKTKALKLRMQCGYVANNWEARKRFVKKYNEAAQDYNQAKHWYMKSLPMLDAK